MQLQNECWAKESRAQTREGHHVRALFFRNAISNMCCLSKQNHNISYPGELLFWSRQITRMLFTNCGQCLRNYFARCHALKNNFARLTSKFGQILERQNTRAHTFFIGLHDTLTTRIDSCHDLQVGKSLCQNVMTLQIHVTLKDISIPVES